MGTAGGCGRKGINLVALVLADHRLANLNLIICQIFHGHQAAVLLGGVHHSLSHFTGVEGILAAVADHSQGLCQIRVGELLTDLIGQLQVIQVNLCQCGNTLDQAVLTVQLFLEGCADDIALAGQVDGVLEDLLSLDAGAVGIQHVLDTGNLTGNRDGETAVLAHGSLGRFCVRTLGGVILHVAFLIQPHLRCCRCRSDLTEVDDGYFVVLCAVDGHETAAADTGEVGFHNAQGVADGCGRIKRVSAGLEHVHTCLGCIPVAGCHSTLLAGSVTVVLLLLEILVEGKPYFFAVEHFGLFYFRLCLLRCRFGLFRGLCSLRCCLGGCFGCCRLGSTAGCKGCCAENHCHTKCQLFLHRYFPPFLIDGCFIISTFSGLAAGFRHMSKLPCRNPSAALSVPDYFR